MFVLLAHHRYYQVGDVNASYASVSHIIKITSECGVTTADLKFMIMSIVDVNKQQDIQPSLDSQRPAE